MDIFKLEEFVEKFNSGLYVDCIKIIDEVVSYNEKDLGESLRKFVLAVNKIKTGNIGGARILIDEALNNSIKFRSLLNKHLPGFLGDLKEMQKGIKSGKVDIQKLKFRKK